MARHETLSVAQFRGELDLGPYAWPGGYPRFFFMLDGESLSFAAALEERERIEREIADLIDPAWLPIACQVNWEDSDLICAHTNKPIESAYGESHNANEP